MKLSTGCDIKDGEIDSIYVGMPGEHNDERFVVSLIVSYDDHRDNVVSVEQALAAAVAMTRDHSQETTMWFVYDRLKGTRHFVAQGEVQHLIEEINA